MPDREVCTAPQLASVYREAQAEIVAAVGVASLVWCFRRR
jgi:hypothetical protein